MNFVLKLDLDMIKMKFLAHAVQMLECDLDSCGVQSNSLPLSYLDIACNVWV